MKPYINGDDMMWPTRWDPPSPIPYPLRKPVIASMKPSFQYKSIRACFLAQNIIIISFSTNVLHPQQRIGMSFLDPSVGAAGNFWRLAEGWVQVWCMPRFSDQAPRCRLGAGCTR